jgi:hypothetical protein
MVAYNFQPQFEPAIVSLGKLGTIRATGARRHARPGEALELYRGMRTRCCQLIARASCSANDRIRISFEHFVIKIGEHPNAVRLVAIDESRMQLLDNFAQGDGFADFAEMKGFWRRKHGPDDFDGRWIQWTPESVRVAL